MMKAEKSTRFSNSVQLSTGRILHQEKIAANLYKLRIRHEKIAGYSLPGQFINLQVTENIVPLLRRPFSLNNVNRTAGWFELLFNVVGAGTKILAGQKSGSEINFLGPLGNNFDTNGNFSQAVLIAGGMGIAPFEFLAHELKLQQKRVVLFWGNRNPDIFSYYSNLAPLVDEVFFATDNGATGFKGTVIELFQQDKEAIENSTSRIFACGPNPMLKKIQQIASHQKLDCQISLETRMACGFGACLGCNVKAAHADGSYRYVCIDGPVFKVEEIEISD